MKEGATGMSDKLSRVSLMILVPCAVAITALVVKRELSPATGGGSHLPSRIRDWRALAAFGHRIGGDSAGVTVVEFGDFECPFCAEFHTMFATLRRAYGDSIALVYRNFPLPTHQHAVAAALAAECAAAQDRFETMYNVLYDEQSAIATQPMSYFASKAGIVDTGAFRRCMASDSTGAVIDRDRDAAIRLGSNGTPTLIVNGDVVQGTIAMQDFEKLVRKHLGDRR
jgi:protein-disulfide isomerase